MQKEIDIDNIGWSNFGKVYCICKLDNNLDEYRRMLHNLDVVGLLHNKKFQFYYQVNNPHYTKMLNAIKQFNSSIIDIDQFANAMTFYNMLQDAWLSEYDRIFAINRTFIVDDVYQIQRALKNIPEDADIISFSENKQVDLADKNVFIQTKTFKISPKCVCLSARGIKYLAQFMTQSLKPFDYYMSFKNTARDYSIRRKISALSIENNENRI